MPVLRHPPILKSWNGRAVSAMTCGSGIQTGSATETAKDEHPTLQRGIVQPEDQECPISMT